MAGARRGRGRGEGDFSCRKLHYRSRVALSPRGRFRLIKNHSEAEILVRVRARSASPSVREKEEKFIQSRDEERRESCRERSDGTIRVIIFKLLTRVLATCPGSLARLPKFQPGFPSSTFAFQLNSNYNFEATAHSAMICEQIIENNRHVRFALHFCRIC